MKKLNKRIFFGFVFCLFFIAVFFLLKKIFDYYLPNIIYGIKMFSWIFLLLEKILKWDRINS